MRLIVVGTIRFPLERMAEARPVMETMVRRTREEDGCLRYHYAEDVLEPGLIHISESWRDQAALDRHFETDHVARWRAAAAMLEVSDRDLCLYQVSEAVRL